MVMVAVLLLPGTALAGGWAVTSFDQLPDEFQAGADYDLTYTILQHGQTPVDVGPSQVVITAGNGQKTTFEATPLTAEGPGRYAVSITFPESGTWTWEVRQGSFEPHEMGAIEVTSLAATTTPALRVVLPIALGLVIALIAVQIVALSKSRRLRSPVRAD
jgi:hypothetical protein